MAQLASSVVLAIAISACGGAPDVGEAATSAAAPDSENRAVAPAASTVGAPPVGASGAATTAVALPHGSPALTASNSAYDIRLLDHNGWPRDVFELVPVRGTGYQTVQAVVVVRGSQLRSPVAGVQPYCAAPIRCDYLAPRNANEPERYTISLSDDSVARLSSTKDVIAISARFLDVERTSVVGVTLTVDGQPPVTKRITYMKSPG